MTTKEVLENILAGFGMSFTYINDEVIKDSVEEIDTIHAESTRDEIRKVAANLKTRFNLKGKPFFVEAKLVEYLNSLKL